MRYSKTADLKSEDQFNPIVDGLGHDGVKSVHRKGSWGSRTRRTQVVQSRIRPNLGVDCFDEGGHLEAVTEISIEDEEGIFVR